MITNKKTTKQTNKKTNKKPQKEEIDVENNMELVNYVINRYFKAWKHDKEYEDLRQVGYVGLCKAKQNYNPDKGCFSTYAVIKIRGEISAWIRGNREHKEVQKKAISLNRKFNEAEDDLTFEERIPSFQYEKMCSDVFAFDFRKNLNEKDKRIFDLMSKSYTYEEIGKKLGLSKSTIKYHAKKIRNKFRNYLYNEGGLK